METNCVSNLSKKDQRWQSKRKKILAFLNIIESDDRQNENNVETDLLPKKQKLKNGKNFKCGEEDKIALKRKLREAKDKLGPEIVLNSDGLNAQLLGPEHPVCLSLAPIFAKDIKHFIYALTQKKLPYTRWCKVVRSHTISQVIVLIIDNLSSNLYCDNVHCFPKVNALSFKMFEVAPPASYGISLIDELCFAPLDHTENIHVMANNETDELAASNEKPAKKPTKKVLKIDLLLSPMQMIIEKYPIPCDEYLDYCFTKMKYKEVCSSSSLYGLDCEMVLTVENKLELVHVSIVDESFDVIYNSYVQPKEPIKDYLTRFSGVTESTLKGVTTTLSDVQSYIQQLLPPDAILCGQSLNFDLHALKMIHPYVIDTSVIYNLTGSRVRKTSLKTLSKAFLGEEIQSDKKGHNPVEDSTAAIKLVLLKLQQGLEFGDVIFDYLQTKQTTIQNSVPRILAENDKMLIVGDDRLLNWYSERNLTQHVDLLKLDRNEFLVNKLLDSKHHNLTFCTLNNKVVRNSENLEKKLYNLDETISKVYNLCETNALFVVVADGVLKDNSHEYENGLCMMKVKLW